MEGWLIIAFCVVACILGVTVAKAFARHRRELIQLRQMIASLEARMCTQSERIAAVESAAVSPGKPHVSRCEFNAEAIRRLHGLESASIQKPESAE